MRHKITGLLMLLMGIAMGGMSQNEGVWAFTMDIFGSYSRGFEEFAATNADGTSGFAKGGGGMGLGVGLSKNWEHVGIGGAYEFRANWQKVDHSALNSYFDAAYASPEALNTSYFSDRRNWGVYTNLMGPTVNVHGGIFLLEGRFLIGRADVGNPFYSTTNGNYVPEGWEKFYLNADNETPTSRKRWNFAYSPQVILRVAANDYAGIFGSGSILFANMRQEMEVIDAVPTSGGISFERRQASFEQPLKMWYAGLGVYLRL